MKNKGQLITHGAIAIASTTVAIMGGWFAARMGIESEISDIKISVASVTSSVTGNSTDIQALTTQLGITNQNLLVLSEHFGIADSSNKK